jgi:hypothetical protein
MPTDLLRQRAPGSTMFRSSRNLHRSLHHEVRKGREDREELPDLRWGSSRFASFAIFAAFVVHGQ